MQIRFQRSNSQSTAEGDCSEGTFSGANGNRGDRDRLHQITRSRSPFESDSHPYKFLELYTSTNCPASATYRELRFRFKDSGHPLQRKACRRLRLQSPRLYMQWTNMHHTWERSSTDEPERYLLRPMTHYRGGVKSGHTNLKPTFSNNFWKFSFTTPYAANSR